MPLPDKVSGRYIHLDIHGCQPCINMEKCHCKCWLQSMDNVHDESGIASSSE